MNKAVLVFTRLALWRITWAYYAVLGPGMENVRAFEGIRLSHIFLVLRVGLAKAMLLV